MYALAAASPMHSLLACATVTRSICLRNITAPLLPCSSAIGLTVRTPLVWESSLRFVTVHGFVYTFITKTRQSYVQLHLLDSNKHAPQHSPQCLLLRSMKQISQQCLIARCL